MGKGGKGRGGVGLRDGVGNGDGGNGGIGGMRLCVLVQRLDACFCVRYGTAWQRDSATGAGESHGELLGQTKVASTSISSKLEKPHIPYARRKSKMNTKTVASPSVALPNRPHAGDQGSHLRRNGTKSPLLTSAYQAAQKTRRELLRGRKLLINTRK